MAKISANYEVVYIIDPAQGEEAVAATVAKFQSLAEQNATDVVVDLSLIHIYSALGISRGRCMFISDTRIPDRTC